MGGTVVALVVGVGRPLRYVEPGQVVEVTTRAIHGRLLLRPSAALNAGILAVLGRGLDRYAVKLHGFAFLSNHYHLVLSVADGHALASFMGFVNRNISELVGRVYGWSGAMWSRRYRCIPIVDEESQVARLRYVLGQGCQEGLVESPLVWPGVHCARTLVGEETLTGVWLDRSRLSRARRTRDDVDVSKFQTRYDVTLTPLPCWAELSTDAWRARCVAMVEGIEDDAQRENARLDRVPMGPAAICAEDPYSRPQSSKRSPAQLVHASSEKARAAFKAMYARFVKLFRTAADRLRGGDKLAVFPAHSFPAPGAFVRPVAGGTSMVASSPVVVGLSP